MGTVATAVLDYYLEAFDTDPAGFARRMTDFFRDSPRTFLEQARAALPSAPDTPAAHSVLAILAAADALGPMVLDDNFPLAAAIRLVRMLSASTPGAALNLVQAAGGLNSVLRGAPGRVLRILELVGATPDSSVRGGVLALLLKHPSPEVRSKAALLLGRSSRDLAWARERMTDPDARIRANAVESAWGLDGKAAVELFREAAADSNNRVAGNACLGLYLAGDASAPGAIRELSRRDNPRFRATAAWVMGETAESQFGPDLSALRDDPDGDVRLAALRALARLRKGRAAPAESRID